MMNFFKKTNQNNLINFKQRKTRKSWSLKEIAIIINAIDDSKGDVVNVGYLSSILHRSLSSIRNKVYEMADKMQRFKLKTTIVPFKNDTVEAFKIRLLNPNRRDVLIRLFYKFEFFNSKTPKITIENFWIFDVEEI